MHKFAKQIMECVKTKVEAMGIDNIEGQHLDELEKWTEIANNIVRYDKNYNIVEAMKEAENEDNMRAIEMYEDYPERRYYDNYRYKTSGRFAPKGRGSYMPRRGYDEPAYYNMTPEMYEKYPAEYYRDMDRQSGKMYYTDMSINPSMRDANEGRSGMSRKTYMETKQMHTNDTQDGKNIKAKKLDEFFGDLYEDMKEMAHDMSNEEKTVWKQRVAKLNQLVQ